METNTNNSTDYPSIEAVSALCQTCRGDFLYSVAATLDQPGLAPTDTMRDRLARLVVKCDRSTLGHL